MLSAWVTRARGLCAHKEDSLLRRCLPTNATPSPSAPQERVKGFMATCLLLSGLLLYVRLDGLQIGKSTISRPHVYLYQGESAPLDAQQAHTAYQTLATHKSPASRPVVKVDPPVQMQQVKPYACLPRSVAVEMLREPGPNSYVALEERPACAYEVRPEEIVVGIWTSKATEHKVQPVLDTWGGKVALELLGSVPSDKFDVMLTGETDDNYFSTLGKGFRGLKKMFEDERHRDKKWFVIMGDDVFLHAHNLATSLSAFSPDEVWAFGQLGINQKPYRLFGGAPIITSREATRKLVPKLEDALQQYKNRGDNTKFHDMAFTDFLIQNGIYAADLKGLYSNPPVYFFCSDYGHLDAKEGVPTYPLAFHYIQGPYLKHINFVLDQLRLCAELEGASHVLSKTVVGLRPSSIPHGASYTQVSESWGRPFAAVVEHVDEHRPLQALISKYPEESWYVLTTADTYVVPENLGALLEKYDGMEEPRLLLATPDDSAGTIVANGVLAKAWAHQAINGTDELAALKSVFADYVRHRAELLSTPYIRRGEEEGGDKAATGEGLCAASVRYNSDWHMVSELQRNREDKSQFHLIDYALHFRRAQQGHELHRMAPPLWYPTAHIPTHCN